MTTLSVEYNYLIKVIHVGLGEYFLHAISDSYIEAVEWGKSLKTPVRIEDWQGNLLLKIPA